MLFGANIKRAKVCPLRTTSSWLFGQNITLADVSVMPALVRMADLGRDSDWADLPRVAKWYELIRAHAAFKPTYYSGSLLTERFPHLQKTAAHG
jgi:glutathione S-transferase